ncbi:hypothetical protein HK098_001350 [Nowakowskiella sp. JEL0407]|nr:hypothetical protein HK098_001350 [Nowakowskiella sp. JEL0407]
MVALTESHIAAKTKGIRSSHDFGYMKAINLWGQGLSDVSILSTIPTLEVVSLAVNHISSLKPFSKLFNLKELHLRKNNVSDISQLKYISGLSKLRVLSLIDNPISELPHYRLQVLQYCPQIVMLDGIPVTDEDRLNAASLTMDFTAADEPSQNIQYSSKPHTRPNSRPSSGNQRLVAAENFPSSPIIERRSRPITPKKRGDERVSDFPVHLSPKSNHPIHEIQNLPVWMQDHRPIPNKFEGNNMGDHDDYVFGKHQNRKSNELYNIFGAPKSPPNHQKFVHGGEKYSTESPNRPKWLQSEQEQSQLHCSEECRILDEQSKQTNTKSPPNIPHPIPNIVRSRANSEINSAASIPKIIKDQSPLMKYGSVPSSPPPLSLSFQNRPVHSPNLIPIHIQPVSTSVSVSSSLSKLLRSQSINKKHTVNAVPFWRRQPGYSYTSTDETSPTVEGEFAIQESAAFYNPPATTTTSSIELFGEPESSSTTDLIPEEATTTPVEESIEYEEDGEWECLPLVSDETPTPTPEVEAESVEPSSVVETLDETTTSIEETTSTTTYEAGFYSPAPSPSMVDVTVVSLRKRHKKDWNNFPPCTSTVKNPETDKNGYRYGTENGSSCLVPFDYCRLYDKFEYCQERGYTVSSLVQVCWKKKHQKEEVFPTATVTTEEEPEEYEPEE